MWIFFQKSQGGNRHLPISLADAMSLETKVKDPLIFEDALHVVTGIRVSGIAPPETIIGEHYTMPPIWQNNLCTFFNFKGWLICKCFLWLDILSLRWKCIGNHRLFSYLLVNEWYLVFSMKQSHIELQKNWQSQSGLQVYKNQSCRQSCSVITRWPQK